MQLGKRVLLWSHGVVSECSGQCGPGMDGEFSATAIQLTVKNTGTNVTLGEIIQEEIIRYPGKIHL